MYGFHLYIVVVIKKAEPQDDYDQNEADPEFNDGSQYLLNFEDEQELLVQENAGEVYLLIILHLLYI